MTLFIIFFNLIDKILEIILKRHPTSEIGLKSHNSCGLTDLGIWNINKVFDPLGHFPLFAKSFTAKRIFFFKQSQQNLMKPKLKPSGPWLFELSHLQTPFLISSSKKAPTSIALSTLKIVLKPTLSNLTCSPRSLSNLDLKKYLTLALTTSLSSHH